jgi:hypothetical protein
MNTVWIVVAIGVGIVGAVAAVVTSLRKDDRAANLGAVSHQWLAEHRPGPGHDSPR